MSRSTAETEGVRESTSAVVPLLGILGSRAGGSPTTQRTGQVLLPTPSQDTLRVIRLFKKSVVTLVGFALVILGVILMPLPGPGLLVTVAGFAILATEYTWARRALDTSKKRAIEGQKQVARNSLTYLGQHIAGIGMIALAVLFLLKPTLPLASGVSATMMIVGGSVLITSAVLARRKYS